MKRCSAVFLSLFGVVAAILLLVGSNGPCFTIDELLEFRICNCWGQVVLHSNDMDSGGDGIDEGNDQNIESYVYTLRAQLLDGSLVSKKGYISLLRSPTRSSPALLQSPYIRAIVSGILLVLAWPPVSLSPLLFVALVPLIGVVSKAEKSRKAFALAYSAFFVWFAGTMYWIGNVAMRAEDQLKLLLAFLLAPLFMTLPVWLFHRLARPNQHNRAWFLLPFFWVAYEFLHSQWDLAFSWLNLGLGLSPASWLTGSYALLGTIGGSFLIVLVNVLVALGWQHRKKAGKALQNRWWQLAVAVLVLMIGAGFWPTPEPTGHATVAVVQANIDPYTKLNKRSLYDQVQQFKKVAAPLRNRKVDLVVGSEGLLRSRPEAPIVVNRIDSNPAIKDLAQFARELNAPVLTGFIGIRFHNDNPDWTLQELMHQPDPVFDIYNGALLIPPDGPVQYATKNKLVPLMEKVPFVNTLPFLEKFRFSLNQSTGSYIGNDSITLLTHGNLRVAPVICLDAAFPEYVRLFNQEGANLLAVISNDGWAGNTSGYLQNASYAQSLAQTFERSVARSANTGQSLFGLPDGSASQHTQWWQEALIVKKLPLHEHHTLYSVTGDWLGWLAVLLVFVCPFLMRLPLLRNT